MTERKRAQGMLCRGDLLNCTEDEENRMAGLTGDKYTACIPDWAGLAKRRYRGKAQSTEYGVSTARNKRPECWLPSVRLCSSTGSQ